MHWINILHNSRQLKDYDFVKSETCTPLSNLSIYTKSINTVNTINQQNYSNNQTIDDLDTYTEPRKLSFSETRRKARWKNNSNPINSYRSFTPYDTRPKKRHVSHSKPPWSSDSSTGFDSTVNVGSNRRQSVRRSKSGSHGSISDFVTRPASEFTNCVHDKVTQTSVIRNSYDEEFPTISPFIEKSDTCSLCLYRHLNKVCAKRPITLSHSVNRKNSGVFTVNYDATGQDEVCLNSSNLRKRFSFTHETNISIPPSTSIDRQACTLINQQSPPYLSVNDTPYYSRSPNSWCSESRLHGPTTCYPVCNPPYCSDLTNSQSEVTAVSQKSKYLDQQDGDKLLNRFKLKDLHTTEKYSGKDKPITSTNVNANKTFVSNQKQYHVPHSHYHQYQEVDRNTQEHNNTSSNTTNLVSLNTAKTNCSPHNHQNDSSHWSHVFTLYSSKPLDDNEYIISSCKHMPIVCECSHDSMVKINHACNTTTNETSDSGTMHKYHLVHWSDLEKNQNAKNGKTVSDSPEKHRITGECAKCPCHQTENTPTANTNPANNINNNN
ncbi:unnamed protein product [Trichobilharzia regenti]|nr:unnamed protein product [Trichobilharzia regenti]